MDKRMIIPPKMWTTILEKDMWLFNVIEIRVGKDINVGKVSEGVEESSDNGRDGGVGWVCLECILYMHDMDRNQIQWIKLLFTSTMKTLPVSLSLKLKFLMSISSDLAEKPAFEGIEFSTKWEC